MIGGGTLAELDPKRNSIGFLRLTAALLVIVGHSFGHGMFSEVRDPLAMWSNNQIPIGRFPVDVFFCLSGFLITMSFTRSRNVVVYLWHRFLRIFPAYWVCIVLTGVVVAPLFGEALGLGYIRQNVPLIAGTTDRILGLFEDNAHGPTVNSALWTLRWELWAYLIVAAVGVLGLFRYRWVTVAGFLYCWGVLIYLIYETPGLATSPAVTSGWRLITFFLAGALFFLYRDKIPMNWKIFAAALGTLVVATVVGALWVPYSAGMFYTVAPLPLTYVVMWLGMRLPFTRINTKVDLSYGIYIYGTLVLGILTSLGWNQTWFPYVTATIAITLVVASLSWFLVEKPALSLKNARLDFRGRSVRVLRHGHPKPAPVGSGSATDV